MTTISKFYLHDAASSDTGTLPPAPSLDPITLWNDAANDSVNRSMDATAGVSQTSATGPTQATTTAQSTWFRRFLSAPIAAQTISAQTVTLSAAAAESSASSNCKLSIGVFLWRPSTGTKINTLLTANAATVITAEPGTTETAVSGSGTSASVTAQDGDILVVEVWRPILAQADATARTDTFYYDGTTDASTSSNAAFVSFATPVTMFTVQPITGVGGIVTAEAFGLVVVTPGPVAITGVGGIASAEAFGLIAVTFGSPQFLTSVGAIASAEAFGLITVFIFAKGLAASGSSLIHQALSGNAVVNLAAASDAEPGDATGGSS